MYKIQQFFKYIEKRFELIPLTLFTSLTLYSISSYKDNNLNSYYIFGFGLIYLCFLFHMRILDEFKDREFDDKNFPDRPLQSGLVTEKVIIIYGVINFVFMTLIAYFLVNQLGFVLYLLSVTYSFLMFKEFFIKDFWEKSPLAYLLSHQIVLVILYLSFSLSFFSIEDLMTFKFVSYLNYIYLPILLIELGRKIKHRKDSNGNNTNDTYAYVWGQRFTINLISILIFASSLLIFVTNSITLIEFVVINAMSLLYITFSFTKKEKFVELSKELTFVLSIIILVIISI